MDFPFIHIEGCRIENILTESEVPIGRILIDYRAETDGDPFGRVGLLYGLGVENSVVYVFRHRRSLVTCLSL